MKRDLITIDIQSHSAAGLMRWGRQDEERSHYHRHTVTQCSRSYEMREERMKRDLITIDIQSHSAAGLMRWGRKDDSSSQQAYRGRVSEGGYPGSRINILLSSL